MYASVYVMYVTCIVIHTYIHTYMQVRHGFVYTRCLLRGKAKHTTYMHVRVYTYTHTYIQVWHGFIHTSLLHACIYIYIHKYIRTYRYDMALYIQDVCFGKKHRDTLATVIVSCMCTCMFMYVCIHNYMYNCMLCVFSCPYKKGKSTGTPRQGHI